jgi:hypothetical protein
MMNLKSEGNFIVCSRNSIVIHKVCKLIVLKAELKIELVRPPVMVQSVQLSLTGLQYNQDQTDRQTDCSWFNYLNRLIHLLRILHKNGVNDPIFTISKLSNLLSLSLYHSSTLKNTYTLT